jgi:hypothetical protein
MLLLSLLVLGLLKAKAAVQLADHHKQIDTIRYWLLSSGITCEIHGPVVWDRDF